jgi:hypothetical protein
MENEKSLARENKTYFVNLSSACERRPKPLIPISSPIKKY